MTERNTKLSDRERRVARRRELQEAVAEVNPDRAHGIHTTERTRIDGKREIVVALTGITHGEVVSPIGPIAVNGVVEQKIPGHSSTRPVVELNLTGIEEGSKGRVDELGGTRTVGVNDMGIGAQQINPDTIVSVVLSPMNLRGDITPKLS